MAPRYKTNDDQARRYLLMLRNRSLPLKLMTGELKTRRLKKQLAHDAKAPVDGSRLGFL